MTEWILKAERSVWKSRRCILLPMEWDQGHWRLILLWQAWVWTCIHTPGLPGNFRIEIANFSMLRAIFISYINAFCQTDAIIFAQLCPWPNKLRWTWPCDFPLPQLFTPPPTCSADKPVVPCATRRLPVSWDLWAACEDGLHLKKTSRCVWSVIPEMRSKWVNLKLTPYLFSSAYTIMKATAIIFYGRWAHRTAVTTSCWFFWGNFWKNYDIWESTIAVLQRKIVKIGEDRVNLQNLFNIWAFSSTKRSHF